MLSVARNSLIACVAGIEGGGGRGEFGRARERESPNSLPLPFRTPATQAIFIMMLKK